jgi:hypothetical protein
VAAEKVFRGLLCYFPDFREFIEAELGQTELRGPHEPPGRALPPWARLGASWATAPSSRPLPKHPGSLMSRKKISKKFRGIWTSFGTDILKNQKQAKNSNWHWALS